MYRFLTFCLLAATLLSACGTQKDKTTENQATMHEIQASEIARNPISLFDEDWALLTAGAKGDLNTMTISWVLSGNFGTSPS